MTTETYAANSNEFIPELLAFLPGVLGRDFIRSVDKSDLYKSTTKFFPYNIYAEMDKDMVVTKYVVEVALAGYSKEDIETTIEKDTLTINVNKKIDDNPNYRKYLRNGISYKSAKLELQMIDIDVKKVHGSFENGLLKLELPVIKPKKEVTTIKIG